MYYFNYKNNTSFYLYLWTFSFWLCTLNRGYIKMDEQLCLHETSVELNLKSESEKAATERLMTVWSSIQSFCHTGQCPVPLDESDPDPTACTCCSAAADSPSADTLLPPQSIFMLLYKLNRCDSLDDQQRWPKVLLLKKLEWFRFNYTEKGHRTDCGCSAWFCINLILSNDSKLKWDSRILSSNEHMSN